MTDRTNTVPLITEQLLEDYADGRLDPQTERRVEGLISQDHVQREKVFRMIALREAIRAEVGARAGLPRQQETYRLIEEIDRRRRPSHRPQIRKAMMAAAASLLVIGFASLLWPPFVGKPGLQQETSISELLSQTGIPEELAAASNTSAQIIHATTETEGGEAAVKPMPDVVPDFAGAGFGLVETRILANQPKEAVHLLYKAEDGRRVSLYYSHTESGRNKQVSVHQEGPLAILFWQAEGRSFSLIGEVGRAELIALARMVTSGLSLENSGNAPEKASEEAGEPQAEPKEIEEVEPEDPPSSGQDEQKADAV